MRELITRFSLLWALQCLVVQSGLANCLTDSPISSKSESITLSASFLKKISPDEIEYFKYFLGRLEPLRRAGNLDETASISSYLNALAGPGLEVYTGLPNEVAAMVGVYGLSRDEIASMYAYSQTFSGQFNFALRKQVPELIDIYSRGICAVQSGLAKLPDYRDWVYRGDNPPSAVLSTYQVGNIVTMAGFTSTSKGAVRNLFVNAPVHLKLLSKHGKDFSSFSAWKSESEILFGYGAKFKITSRETGNDGKVHVTMEEQ